MLKFSFLLSSKAVLAAVLFVMAACGESKNGLAQGASEASGDQAARGAEARCYRQGRWCVAETKNFQVCSVEADADVLKAAQQAETLRSQLAETWLGEVAQKPWTPRCQIVLHASRAGYIAAVGSGSGGTLGSSAVTYGEQSVIGRRIDLLAIDADYLVNVLPHELTHVLLRDRFASGDLPRWADEGMAMLADPPAKQARHIHDLRAAMNRGEEYSAAELLAMHGYPSIHRRQAFYGQSIIIAKFLIVRGSPQQFLAFLERAADVGNDAALRECYRIDGTADLDHRWRRNLYNSQLASLPGA